MIPPEAEFVAVTVQVFLGKLVKDAIVPPLQQGEETFGRVRVHQDAILVPTSILADTVLKRSMLRRIFGNTLVKIQFVSHDDSFLSPRLPRSHPCLLRFPKRLL